MSWANTNIAAAPTSNPTSITRALPWRSVPGPTATTKTARNGINVSKEPNRIRRSLARLTGVGTPAATPGVKLHAAHAMSRRPSTHPTSNGEPSWNVSRRLRSRNAASVSV